MVCIQELKAEYFLLRYFLFVVKQVLFLRTLERNEGLQSIISLRGEMDYSVKGLPTIAIREKEFYLLNAQNEPAIIGLKWGKPCSILNAYYQPSLYEDLLEHFPLLKKQLKKAKEKAAHFSAAPKVARASVHDAIQAIWLDRYAGSTIQKKYIQKRIETGLVTMLAQTYHPSVHEKPSTREREKAAEASALILQNIRKHIPVEEIAEKLHCTPSWLQKAFSKVYGMGLRHYLRVQRMMLAKEMLLQALADADIFFS